MGQGKVLGTQPLYRGYSPGKPKWKGQVGGIQATGINPSFGQYMPGSGY